MKVAREETFGPVAPLFRFKDEAEAIAHGQRHASSGSPRISTRATSAASSASPRRSRPGIVGVNVGIISNEVAPFGGVKQSGLGREGSKYGIEDFLEIKYVCLGGIQ